MAGYVSRFSSSRLLGQTPSLDWEFPTSDTSLNSTPRPRYVPRSLPVSMVFVRYTVQFGAGTHWEDRNSHRRHTSSARLHATNSWRTGRGGAHCARRPILKKARANASSLAGIALRDAAAPVHRRVPRPPRKEGENAVSGDGPCLARMYVVCTRHPAWLRPNHVGASSLAAVCRFWNAPGPL